MDKIEAIKKIVELGNRDPFFNQSKREMFLREEASMGYDDPANAGLLEGELNNFIYDPNDEYLELEEIEYEREQQYEKVKEILYNATSLEEALNAIDELGKEGWLERDEKILVLKMFEDEFFPENAEKLSPLAKICGSSVFQNEFNNIIDEFAEVGSGELGEVFALAGVSVENLPEVALTDFSFIQEYLLNQDSLYGSISLGYLSEEVLDELVKLVNFYQDKINTLRETIDGNKNITLILDKAMALANKEMKDSHGGR